MDGITLLRKAQLKGTAYFEFALRDAHWNPDSVYLSLDDFDRIAPIFSEHLKEFNYFGLNPITRQDWEQLLKDLSMHVPQLADWLRSQLPSQPIIYLMGV